VPVVAGTTILASVIWRFRRYRTQGMQPAAPDVAAPQVTDAELAALALAADPDAEVGPDAVSLWAVAGVEADGPLPSWYMPAPMRARRFSGWRARVVRLSACSVIASFVVISAAGLCNTYGQLHL
jgi:hypothetical protein